MSDQATTIAAGQAPYHMQLDGGGTPIKGVTVINATDGPVSICTDPAGTIALYSVPAGTQQATPINSLSNLYAVSAAIASTGSAYLHWQDTSLVAVSSPIVQPAPTQSRIDEWIAAQSFTAAAGGNMVAFAENANLGDFAAFYVEDFALYSLFAKELRLPWTLGFYNITRNAFHFLIPSVLGHADIPYSPSNPLALVPEVGNIGLVGDDIALAVQVLGVPSTFNADLSLQGYLA